MKTIAALHVNARCPHRAYLINIFYVTSKPIAALHVNEATHAPIALLNERESESL